MDERIVYKIIERWPGYLVGGDIHLDDGDQL